MLIKPLEVENQYDIFLGKGWDNWLRVEVKPGKVVTLINKNEQVTVSPKLLELVYYKVKKLERKDGVE